VRGALCATASVVPAERGGVHREQLPFLRKPASSLWRLKLCLGALLSVGASISAATTVTLSYLEGKNPVSADAITAYGPDLMGDKVNLFNGSLEFEHTDINLPGNSSLAVALIRRYSVGRPRDVLGQFGDWDLEAPRIGGSFAGQWRTNTGGTNRCTGFSAPPQVTGYSGPQARGVSEPLQPIPEAREVLESAAERGVVGFIASDYWQGTFLHVPGQGSQEVLRRASAYTHSPGSVTDYPLVTHQNWQISCLDTVQNADGEGFLATSPDGVKYRFDWMASRYHGEVKKSGAVLGRSDVFLMATRVTDRFGNWVSYTYDPQNPYLLKRIDASDGRFIQLNIVNGATVSATDGTRTFTYGYNSGSGFGPGLSWVQQPDGSRWIFNLSPMTAENLTNLGENATCDYPGDSSVLVGAGTITHPSGAVGKFEAEYQVLGRSHVERRCKSVPGVPSFTIGAVWPKWFISQVLTKKELSGPGLDTLVWAYGYSSEGSWSDCTTCSDLRQVFVTSPSGIVTTHTFGNRWRVSEGQLLQVDEAVNGGTALKTTTTTYRPWEGQTYPEQFGTSNFRHSDWLSSRNRPQDKRVISLQGSTFTWQVEPTAAGFDYFARPVLARKFSSLGHSRTEATSYRDFDAPWVRGQVERVTETTTGRDVERHEFYAGTGLKYRSFAFDKLTQRFEYDLVPGTTQTGTLAAVFDDAGKATRLNNYMRGKPQVVRFQDNSFEEQQVNNLGNADWIKNAAGTVTRFEFDLMGRVNKITYPTGDPVAYNPTFQTFEQVNAVELGLGAGHWRQTISTGDARTVHYFDAMWRKRLEHRYDTNNPAGTGTFMETRYDNEGRKSFESYPQRLATPVGAALDGRLMEYDGIHRLRFTRANSELPANWLITQTEYLSNFQRRVTNPRGYATTYAYQAFDTPSDEAITGITAPQNVNVGIQRDVFGKPTAITRSGYGTGAYAGTFASATRSYSYDYHQRLCKTVEPETRATVQAYDQAGNLEWRASGLNLTGPADCEQDRANVPPGRKVTFGYDLRDRLTSTMRGDGSGGSTRRYTPDGKLEYSLSDGWIWNYRYNNRRLLIEERYALTASTNENWPNHHDYDANGHHAQVRYWGGISVDHAPNALGQPTKAGAYASNARWHPNGALASYTLANGIVHTTTQNKRGLPEIWTDSSALDDRYTYDENGNVNQIRDWASWTYHRNMSYDGLDRLWTANGSWGAGGYDYDALDNIRRSTVGGRTLTHNIDADTNRLSSLSGSTALSLSYDDNGNITQRGAQAFRFDISNRMTEAVGKALYSYDAEGRRSWVRHPDGNFGGMAYGQDGKLFLSGHTVHGTNWYIYLGGKQIAEHHVGGPSGDQVRYIHTDALGSPVLRSSASGALASGSRSTYEPYGATMAPSGILPGFELGFTGHVNDAETGLTYMQQRYYEPLAGRFLSVDPVVTDEKTGDHFNRYRYAANNPYKYKDPTGRIFETAFDVFSLALSVAEFKSSPSIGNALGVVIDAAAVAIPGIPGGVGAIRSATSTASSAVQAVKLEKALASEAQTAKILAGKGEAVAGAGTKTEFRDAGRVAAEHGGQAKDWSKVSGGNHVAKDGTKIETHAVENKVTGQVQELKTKLKDEGK
jgi:RHS repeat-associated protein